MITLLILILLVGSTYHPHFMDRDYKQKLEHAQSHTANRCKPRGIWIYKPMLMGTLCYIAQKEAGEGKEVRHCEKWSFRARKRIHLAE